MNVLIIPSWYPSEAHPLNGIFTQEQAEAIANIRPDINVMVSTWGHGDGEIPVRKPWNILKVLYWRVRQKNDLISFRKGVAKLFNPAVSWSHRLPFGGAARLIDANRRNLNLAIERFGKINLIHAHVSYPAGYVAAILSEEYKIPYVLTEHMGPFPFPSLMRHGKPLPEIERAFQNADKIIAVSRSLSERVASFGYQESIVIPNVVDERCYSLGEPSGDKFVFFTLCGLTDQKGIDHLLHAIARWNPPSDRFEFKVGGDGPMRREYEQLAVRLGVADRVRWLGPVSREDAPQLFHDCHVYVMPSRHETFGVVYAEAIASGKPVIATRCGGPEDIVKNINGLLVEVGDIEGLAASMETMSADWTAYNAQDIRNDFLGRFSRQAVVTQLVTLYQHIVNRV